MTEKLDRAETVEGSSVCDSVEECLGGMEDQFEMLDLSTSSSSAGPISDDGWAVVPEAGEYRTRGYRDHRLKGVQDPNQ